MRFHAQEAHINIGDSLNIVFRGVDPITARQLFAALRGAVGGGDGFRVDSGVHQAGNQGLANIACTDYCDVTHAH